MTAPHFISRSIARTLPLPLLCLGCLLAGCGGSEGGDEMESERGANNQANNADNNQTNNAGNNTENSGNNENNNNQSGNAGNNAENAGNNGDNQTPNSLQRPAYEVASPAESAEATYDVYLLPDLLGVVDELSYLEATVTKDGADVSVDTGEDEINGTFESDPELGHCVANEDVPFFKLCFFRANGDPAEAGALGAIFRPQGDNVFAIAAHRRGLRRPCTRQGHYEVEATDISTEGDAAIEQQIVDRLFDYLALFIVGESATVILGDVPRGFEIELDDAAGTFSGSVEEDVIVINEAEWDLDVELLDGSLDLDDDGSASVSTQITATVTNPDDDSATTVTATLSGSRL